MSQHFTTNMDKCSRSLLCILWIILTGIESLKVSMNPNITAVIGSSNVQLKCNFTFVENDTIGKRIELEAKHKTSDENFVHIATFYRAPRLDNATLTPQGEYLSGRVKLENPTDSSNVAVLSFSEVQCIDDTNYRCHINYEILGEENTEMSEPTKLTITTKPSKPDNITSNSTLDAIFDGQFVSFTCKGNVGKPPGTFIYRKYRIYEQYPMNYTDIVTTYEDGSEKCSFYGTSNLTIQLSYLDNNATIECVEESFASWKNMTGNIGPITVYYEVREITITKSPNKEIYQTGSMNNVHLTCNADANPIPKYEWRQNEKPDLILSTEKNLIINDLTVTKSGNYTCRAYNKINGNLYTKSEQINITIVESQVNSVGIENSPNSVRYVVVGTAVSASILTVVLIAVILVCCKSKCSKQHRTQDTVRFDNVDNKDIKSNQHDGLSPVYSIVKDVKNYEIRSNVSKEKAENNYYAEVERISNGTIFQQVKT